MVTGPVVYVVDDDPKFRESLRLTVNRVGLSVEASASAEEFLDGYTDTPSSPRCMVLDTGLPGLSGFGLQKMIAAHGKRIPIIMVSDCADVSMAVEAMKIGAVDFLEKPLSRQVVLERIHEALDQNALQCREEVRRTEFSTRQGRLSDREREVMDLLVAGKHAKQVAAKFKIGEKTVAKHRARVFEKMQVDGIAQLVHLVLTSSCWTNNLATCSCSMSFSSIRPLQR